jgi:signal peptidase II
MVSLRSHALVALTLLATVSGDWITKTVVRRTMDPGESHWLINNQIGLQYVRNRRFAFNLGPDSRFGIALVAVALGLIVIALWTGQFGHGRLINPASGLILGGAIGNLIDRLGDNSVVDFAALSRFPRFNGADAALTVGIVIAAFGQFRVSSEHYE